MKAETKNVTRVWPCSECSKTFGRKGDLTRHELLHLGYKPHKCDAPGCGKEFSQFSGLKTHKNVHTKEKPYVCRINGCVASFGDPSSCARHRKETHFRTGGYHCPVPRCNSRIKRRSAFAAHLKRHHIDTVALDIDIFAPPLLPAAIPEPRRRSFSEIISCDVKPATNKETEMPFKFSDADRDYIYSRRSVHGHSSDTALYGNPYSKFAETYHTLYPSTVPPSVATTFSHLALSSNPFEYSSEGATRWEDLVDKLYVLDSSSPQAPEAPQTDINMYNTPPSSPAGESSASESSSTGELHTVNISQGALTFDHFAFPPPTPSRGFFGQTSKHCHIPQKNLADLPFLTGLSPEATYTFA